MKVSYICKVVYAHILCCEVQCSQDPSLQASHSHPGDGYDLDSSGTPLDSYTTHNPRGTLTGAGGKGCTSEILEPYQSAAE